MNGLEALKNIIIDMEYVTRLDFVEPIVRGEVQQHLYKIYHREEKELDIIERELKENQERKNIAKHYKWDDIVSEIYNVNTDRKYRDLFDSAIEIIQQDYNKARVLEIINKIGLHETEIILCVDYDTYCEMREKPIPEEEFNKIKRFLS